MRDARCASFSSFPVVFWMSLPILAAILANSLRCAFRPLPPAPAGTRGAAALEDAARKAADSTAARNSEVRSKKGRDILRWWLRSGAEGEEGGRR